MFLKKTIVLLTALLITSTAASALEHTFYEGFEKGKIKGVVGKAGRNLRIDARSIFDMDRGTIAFFYQSKKEPKEREWSGIGGVTTHRHAGYWGMAAMFQTRRQETIFNLFDIGFYAPPLKLPTVFGRWKAGTWHHMCAVWDRAEGINIYEDGKKVASNWGEYNWQWGALPFKLSLGGPLDEVYIYNQCLTDKQVADLAAGKKPSGKPIAISSADARREKDLARYGWKGQSLKNIPTVDQGKGTAIHYARIRKGIDAKRPTALLSDGYLNSTWPSHKYGSSIRGQVMDLTMEENQNFDRVVFFSHRNFKGSLLSTDKGKKSYHGSFDIPHAMYWHQKLEREVTSENVLLERDYGQLGEIAFYKTEKLSRRPRSVDSFTLKKLKAFPVNNQGKTLQAETPHRFWNPAKLTQEKTPEWKLDTPAFGGFQAVADAPKKGTAYDGVILDLVIEGIKKPTPVHIEIKEPVNSERTWLFADTILKPGRRKNGRYSILLKGRPVINIPDLRKYKYLGNKKYSKDKIEIIPGLNISLSVTAAEPLTWVMGNNGTTLNLVKADKRTIIEKATEDQIEYMRDGYSYLMEGHMYYEPQIQRPLLWLALYAPENRYFKQMWERVDNHKPMLADIKISPLKWSKPVNNTGWPEWAFWQKQATDRLRSHVHWIIDNKQVWTGEYGGIWNDDSTHIENW
ncbi:MAG: LamG-like jellyroll fold domain-containing protein, partial [Planctomycetota bacterium]